MKSYPGDRVEFYRAVHLGGAVQFEGEDGIHVRVTPPSEAHRGARKFCGQSSAGRDRDMARINKTISFFFMPHLLSLIFHNLLEKFDNPGGRWHGAPTSRHGEITVTKTTGEEGCGDSPGRRN